MKFTINDLKDQGWKAYYPHIKQTVIRQNIKNIKHFKLIISRIVSWNERFIEFFFSSIIFAVFCAYYESLKR